MNQCVFNCYFIGDDSLLIEFAEFLLSEGHGVLGFLTTNPQVRNWAHRHHAKCFSNLDSLVEGIANSPPDYIFSFINNKVIPSSILKHIRYFAINYHNALLPKYSGNHATSWAILNDEKQHGITWHVVTDIIDGGDILKQATVPIAPNDTTLSLDLKCLRKALETFPELIKELAQKNYTLTKQEKTERDYHALHQKPPGNGLIDWSLSAEEIDRLYRALNFSLYTNRLALPKFVIEGEIYIILELSMLAHASSAPAGTIIELTNTHLCVSTATKNIKLNKVSNVDGLPYSINELKTRHQLKEGDKFPSYPTWCKKLEEISTQLSKHESYWVNKLSHDNPVSLPFSNLEKQYSSTAKSYTSFEFQLPAKEYKEFSELEPKVILLTILFIYFYRINNYQDGSIALNDSIFIEEIASKELRGFFASYLPYSISLQPDMLFVEAVKQVMYELRLQKERRTYSRDIIMRYPSLREKNNRYPIAILILNDGNEYRPNNNYLISFLITESGNNLLMFVKNSLMLKKKEKSFINNMKQSIQSLLDAALDKGSQPIKNLPLLTKDDYEKIIHKWNESKTNYPQNKTLHELIEIQAQERPNHYAVKYKENYLTYAELNTKANHLASYLRKLGVNKEEPIILCINNSLELIIGILGILKAGCAYVPIDHNYNKVFIQYIIKDSASKIIITNSELSPVIEQCLPVDSILDMILIDTNWDLIEQETIKEIPKGNGSDLAYILYTSGTTGNPKGCLIEHKSVINLLYDFQQKSPLTSQDISTFWTSIGFDVSIYEIFSPLIAGATLQLFDRKDISLDPYQYFKKLQSYKITSAYIPLFMLDKFLIWVKHNKYVMALKRLLVGVEPINENLLIELQHFIVNLSIINGYGPTETTICSTLYRVKDFKRKGKRITPIGKPVANTQVYILDSFMQPVPIGVLGELCIAGVGLARGYLNHEELTRTKFVTNPFSKNSHDKLYKTGDLACWLPDGNIEFHGRLDNQVKIRGFRVELNAIEDCLLSHPAISKAVVNVEFDQYNKHKHIVAYLQLNDAAHSLNVDDVRNYLRARLSEYMIPSVLFTVDNFPVTTNGKIDRKALSSLTNKQQLSHKDYVAAKTEVQQQLIHIWQEFLPIKEIGILDDFFALGGHSLLVAEIFTRIQQEFNKAISLQGFLRKPTIQYLANQLERRLNEHEEEADIPNFDKEIQLDIEIQPIHTSEQQSPPKAILLTGVTGFIGIHLLDALFHSTEATIYCLIREKDLQQAKNKLEHALNHYCFSEICFSPRIVVLVGDLAKEKLGLSNLVWQELAEKIDAIYHNGAWVHHVYNYETLKPANVESTINLLKLASSIKPKIVHYFSTLTASISRNKEEPLLETFPQPVPADYLLNGGYEQTKWVSECLVAEAHRRGLPVNIFRLGWIGPQSKTGICSPCNNHFLLFMKGCIQLDVAPARNNEIDIVPVDIASKVIVNLSLKKTGQVFHISSNSVVAWPKLIDWINEAGYQVKLVPPGKWHQHLMHIDRNNALYPFLPLYNAGETPIDWLSLHENLPKIETQHTSAVLESLGISYPPFSKDTFFTYLHYLQTAGFLRAPTNVQYQDFFK